MPASPATPAPAAPRGSRAALVVAVVAAALALLLAQQPWLQRALGKQGLSGDALWNGLPSALALAALAGLGVLVMMGSLGRRVMAGVVAPIAAIMVVLGLVPRSPSGVATDVESLPGRGGPVAPVFEATGVAWGFAAVALVLTLATLLLVVRPGEPRRRTLETLGDGPRRPGEQWALLDRGIDPTEHL